MEYDLSFEDSGPDRWPWLSGGVGCTAGSIKDDRTRSLDASQAVYILVGLLHRFMSLSVLFDVLY